MASDDPSSPAGLSRPGRGAAGSNERGRHVPPGGTFWSGRNRDMSQLSNQARSRVRASIAICQIAGCARRPAVARCSKEGGGHGSRALPRHFAPPFPPHSPPPPPSRCEIGGVPDRAVRPPCDAWRRAARGQTRSRRWVQAEHGLNVRFGSAEADTNARKPQSPERQPTGGPARWQSRAPKTGAGDLSNRADVAFTGPGHAGRNAYGRGGALSHEGERRRAIRPYQVLEGDRAPARRAARPQAAARRPRSGEGGVARSKERSFPTSALGRARGPSARGSASRTERGRQSPCLHALA